MTYNSEDNNGFVVTHRTNGSIRHFHQSRKGLHYLDLSKRIDHILLTTVKDNKEHFTRRDVKRADAALKLQRVTENQTVRDLLLSIRTQVKNCPVTSADVKLAEVIYGPNITDVRGKTVRRNEPAFRVENIPISIPEI